VSLCLITTTPKVVWESEVASYPSYYMQVSDQLRAPAPLLLRKEPPVRIRARLGVGEGEKSVFTS
jgi:hypothetical protein